MSYSLRLCLYGSELRMRLPLILLAAGAIFSHLGRAASPFAVESPDGMVVTAQHLASETGAAILRQGGNAVDAAVAVGYAVILGIGVAQSVGTRDAVKKGADAS